MTQTVNPPAKNLARPLGVSLKPDRMNWVKETAAQNGIGVSELVRRCIDAARKNPKALGL